jgi:hypothetical protein
VKSFKFGEDKAELYELIKREVREVLEMENPS